MPAAKSPSNIDEQFNQHKTLYYETNITAVSNIRNMG
jgi:hypothetical protein